MDKLTSIQVFLMVADTGSFSHAARRLGMSRAAASKHVQHLEAHLGVKLLVRTTREVRVTTAGSNYSDSCRQAVADLELADALASGRGREPIGSLRVLAPINFALDRLGPAISAFLLEFPKVRLELTMSDDSRDPSRGDFDVIIKIQTTVPESKVGVQAVKLATSSRILCASPTYLEAAGVPTQPSSLADHSCLSYSYVDGPTLWRLKKGRETVEVRVSGPLVTSSGQVLRAAALSGLGIAYGPESFFRGELVTGQLVQVLRDFELPCVSIYALSMSERKHRGVVDAFTSFMSAYLAALRPAT
jgi:DNA-binding transcriptional LysR family regulator